MSRLSACVLLAATTCAGVPRAVSVESGIDVTVRLGGTCPHEPAKADGACRPEPLAGAVVVISTSAGNEVTRQPSDASGSIRFSLEPGTYTLEPIKHPQAFVTPGKRAVSVRRGERTAVLLTYNTGLQ